MEKFGKKIILKTMNGMNGYINKSCAVFIHSGTPEPLVQLTVSLSESFSGGICVNTYTLYCIYIS